MSIIEQFAKFDSFARNKLKFLPPHLFINLYSNGRKEFLYYLSKSTPNKPIILDNSVKTKLWDIEFNCPLFNSAGMFKTGEGYELVYRQGAGAYLSGTTTSGHRVGNVKQGIHHPFAPFPKSKSAINWMGLPNPGHADIANKLSKINKHHGCPIGASISADIGDDELAILQGVVLGFKLFDKANVDFIELNESCPNVIHSKNEIDSNGLDKNLINRLEYVSKNYLSHRLRNLPIIVKFSNDTDIKLLPELIDIAIELGFNGINFGNTSTAYKQKRDLIYKSELNIYDYFTTNFGGGLSGKILKEDSLKLCTTAVEYLKTKTLNDEFHIIRTGGVEKNSDILAGLNKGIKLNQWFTGYFEAFSKYGHNLYKNIFS